MTYQGIDKEWERATDPQLKLGDRLHYTTDGQIAHVRDLVPRFVEAWTEMHPDVEAIHT